MARFAAVLLIVPAAFAGVCGMPPAGSGNSADCPGVITSSGAVSNTSPSVTAAVDVSYSSMGNSAARTATYTYLTGDTLSDTSGAICIALHGGGDSAGDSHGDFLFSSGAEALIYPLQMNRNDGKQVCRTIVDFDYTMFANGRGTNAPYPAPLQDVACGVRWAAHKAGTLFPGSKDDIRLMSFSWGTHIAMNLAYNLSAITPVCEWTDSYTITSNVMLSVLPNIGGQWTGEGCPGGGGCDATFKAGIQGAFNCTNCSGANFGAWDIHSVITSGAAAAVPSTVVQGTSDTITNPTYQGSVMASDWRGFGLDLNYFLDPVDAHNASCKIALLTTGQCFWVLMHALAQPAPATAFIP